MRRHRASCSGARLFLFSLPVLLLVFLGVNRLRNLPLDEKENGVIVLIPDGGLANRLGALVGGVVLARLTQRRLVLDWRIYPGVCSADFRDLFMEADFVSTDIPHFRKGEGINLLWAPTQVSAVVYQPFLCENLKTLFGSYPPVVTLHVNQYLVPFILGNIHHSADVLHAFGPRPFLNITEGLAPIPMIKELANELINDSAFVIGVQVRATDQWFSATKPSVFMDCLSNLIDVLTGSLPDTDPSVTPALSSEYVSLLKLSMEYTGVIDLFDSTNITRLAATFQKEISARSLQGISAQTLKVLLITDSEEMKATFSKRFGKLLATSMLPADRTTRLGMQHALAELCALSRADVMLFTFASTFGDAARNMRGDATAFEVHSALAPACPLVLRPDFCSHTWASVVKSDSIHCPLSGLFPETHLWNKDCFFDSG
mmetsp:Transcript_45160/g.113714  ORF Transcript_45160/g.113714 Transcript_45160/m.113714 type:complete len:430 (+) Transcript_45160:69-1358(+)